MFESRSGSSVYLSFLNQSDGFRGKLCENTLKQFKVFSQRRSDPLHPMFIHLPPLPNILKGTAAVMCPYMIIIIYSGRSFKYYNSELVFM